VGLGFASGRNQDALGVLVAVAEPLFPWISSGLVAHFGGNIVSDLLVALGEFEKCLYHQQPVFDPLRIKIGLDQGFFPGDKVSIRDRSGIIVPKMRAQLGNDFFESISGLLLSLAVSCPFGN
jgi:hypothetical protein